MDIDGAKMSKEAVALVGLIGEGVGGSGGMGMEGQCEWGRGKDGIEWASV